VRRSRFGGPTIAFAVDPEARLGLIKSEEDDQGRRPRRECTLPGFVETDTVALVSSIPAMADLDVRGWGVLRSK
jgi:hypothetical protein